MTIPRLEPGARRRIADTIRAITEDPRSDFYRRWFAGRVRPEHALDETMWRQVPLLSRDAIIDSPLWERTFVSRKNVHVVRSTSGTSTRRPLLTPRCLFGSYETYLKAAGVTRQLSFILPWFMSEEARRTGGLVHMNCHYPETDSDYRYAARLTKLLKADSVYGYPHAMIALAPYLAEEGILPAIRAVELSGERCSEAQRRELLRLYDDPILYQNYAASEWRGIFGVPCAHTLENRLLSFHLEDTYFLSEFIDPETGESADPIEPRELVLTSLSADQPFPLVRYRTGDLLVIDEAQCPCGQGPRFMAAGRAASDRIRLTPGEFSLVWIEQAIASCASIRADEYEAHYREAAGGRGVLMPGLEMRVIPLETFDERAVADEIARVLRVGADLTYEAAVERGMLLPLSVAILTEPVRTPSGKRVRLIRNA